MSSTSDAVTIGVDVGGSKVLAVVLAGEELASTERTDTPHGFEAVVAAAAELAGRLVDEHAAAAVGVGVAGMISFDGHVVYSPNLPTVSQAPLARELARRCTVPVVVDNDANCAALAEARIGAGRGASHVLCVTLGTGIGGGFVVDGAVARGAHGFFAEIGHFTVREGGPRCACGADGHWEAIACGPALARLAAEHVETGGGAEIVRVAGGAPITSVHVAAAARAGDGEAIGLIERFADDVAVGLAGLANILDPEVIVVGGGLVDLGDLLLVPLRARVCAHLEGAAHRPPVEVRAAALGPRANAVGAALTARDALERATRTSRGARASGGLGRSATVEQ